MSEHPASPAPDLEAIKVKQHATWSAGDYAVVGTTLQLVGEKLSEALDLRPGQRVLDVAAGNGNASLAAARRWCDVVSTDYVEALLKRGMERANAERLTIAFRRADAEDLPFDENSFDAVTSTFGVMFTPNQEKAAQEIVRVCRSGGKIGLANWTPDSFVGQLFKTIGKHVPPPEGLPSPAMWGTRERLNELFDEDAVAIDASEQTFNFRYKSGTHWLDMWRTVYGPLQKAFDALDMPARDDLAEDLHGLVDRYNMATDGAMVVPARYLEVVITIR